MSLKLQVFKLATFVSVCLTSGAQPMRVAHLALDDARPVYKAIRELEKRYGWSMTYEDPPFEHASELRDATHPDYKRAHPNEAPALLPKQHRLNFTFKIPQDDADEPDLEDTIGALLASHKASANPGFFAFDHIGAVVHVHPVQMKKQNGQIAEFRSIMGTAVSFPKAKRSAFDTLLMILSQVSEGSQHPISLGNIPTNGLMTSSGEHEAYNRPAREVLIEVIDDINRFNMEVFNHPAHIVWDLLYDPTFKSYFFNAHFITVEKKGPFGATVREPR